MEAPDADEVSVFMSQLGLHEDVEILRKERITMDILKDMTKQELKSIGIPFGNSVKITRALAKNSSAAENKESSFEETKTEVESSSDVISDVDASPPSAKFKDNLKMFKELKHLPIKCGPIAGKEEDSANDGNENDNEDILRLVLLGKTGAGKSATANTILGKQHFRASSSFSSVHDGCSTESVYKFSRTIQVIDTPGLFDTSLDNEYVQKEIVRCIAMSSPGPHAFILVLNIARFTKEEEESVLSFVKLFGEFIYEYFIILFTRKDDLEFEGKNLDSYISSAPASLKKLIKNCGHRCISFNNRENDIVKVDKQVKALLQLIDDNISKKSLKYYTDEMFEEAERQMQKIEEEIKQNLAKKRQEKHAILKKEIEEKYSEKENKMKMQLYEIESKIRLAKSDIQEKEHSIDEFLEKLLEEKAAIKAGSEKISMKKCDDIASLQETIQQQENKENKSLRKLAVEKVSLKGTKTSAIQKMSNAVVDIKVVVSKRLQQLSKLFTGEKGT